MPSSPSGAFQTSVMGYDTLRDGLRTWPGVAEASAYY
jgi:hypothetical protein